MLIETLVNKARLLAELPPPKMGTFCEMQIEPEREGSFWPIGHRPEKHHFRATLSTLLSEEALPAIPRLQHRDRVLNDVQPC